MDNKNQVYILNGILHYYHYHIYVTRAGLVITPIALSALNNLPFNWIAVALGRG